MNHIHSFGIEFGPARAYGLCSCGFRDDWPLTFDDNLNPIIMLIKGGRVKLTNPLTGEVLSDRALPVKDPTTRRVTTPREVKPYEPIFDDWDPAEFAEAERIVKGE